jgi:UDP-GlcNAc:undecaprenyl-phosphate GlcNAc-1-phosphate transferase
MHAVVAGLAAAIATYLLVPLAIRIAVKTSFLDLPTGYKGHKRPTPYLGGAAILGGILIGIAAGGLHGRYAPVVIGGVTVWALGTLDDRVNLPILLRVGVEMALAVWFVHAGLGWAVFHVRALDTALTIFWMLGLMNAFNLMDNMDGAAASTAAASALGAAGLALISNQRAPATLCLAAAGACVGFLPWNLSRPAKIFMGDGGSLPLGLIAAAMTMTTVSREYFGPSGVVVAALLVGLVIFDTTLVTVSRSRAGRPVLSGGRDHTTHRLRRVLGTPRKVALTLAAVQLVLCGITIGVAQAGTGWILLTGGVCVGAAIVLMWQFETSTRLGPVEQMQTRSVLDDDGRATISGHAQSGPVQIEHDDQPAQVGTSAGSPLARQTSGHR